MDTTFCFLIPALQTLGLGYNQEMTSKHGKCHNGICVLDYIPLGCTGPKYDSLRTPKNVSTAKVIITHLDYDIVLSVQVLYGITLVISFKFLL